MKRMLGNVMLVMLAMTVACDEDRGEAPEGAAIEPGSSEDAQTGEFDDDDVGGSTGEGQPEPEPGDPPEPTEPPDDSGRTLFNFTVAADRAAFVAHDLEYWMSAGPYALYEVTGDSPWLEGPALAFEREDSFVMLCGASRYFSEDEEAASFVDLSLYGGPRGTDALRTSKVRPTAPEGNCSSPADTYGRSTPPDANDEGEYGVERLSIRLDPPPPVGAIVLLRQAGFLLEDPGHNESHVIPGVCCESRQSCELDPPG